MRHMGARMTTTRSRCQGWVGGGGRVGEGGRDGGGRMGASCPGMNSARGGLLQTLVGLNYADPFDHFQTMLWL